MKTKIAFILALLMLMSVPFAGIAENLDKSVNKTVRVQENWSGGIVKSQSISALTLRTSFTVTRLEGWPNGVYNVSTSILKGLCGIQGTFSGTFGSLTTEVRPSTAGEGNEMVCSTYCQFVGGNYYNQATQPSKNVPASQYQYGPSSALFAGEFYSFGKIIR